MNHLVISSQELHELQGILNPVWDSETKIESFDETANSHRLKLLQETNKQKETLYKIVSEMAEVKSDYIRLTETNEELRYSESHTIIRKTVEDNESIHNLLRLERFKEWVKKNWITLGSVMIGMAGIIRNAIKKGRVESKKKLIEY